MGLPDFNCVIFAQRRRTSVNFCVFLEFKHAENKRTSLLDPFPLNNITRLVRLRRLNKTAWSGTAPKPKDDHQHNSTYHLSARYKSPRNKEFIVHSEGILVISCFLFVYIHFWAVLVFWKWFFSPLFDIYSKSPKNPFNSYAKAFVCKRTSYVILSSSFFVLHQLLTESKGFVSMLCWLIWVGAFFGG